MATSHDVEVASSAGGRRRCHQRRQARESGSLCAAGRFGEPSHPVGGNKARVFESAFGFNRSNADDLTAQIRKGVMEQPPIPGKVDQYGSRFTVDIPVTGPKGSGLVRTGWIVDPGSVTPRLTTAYPR